MEPTPNSPDPELPADVAEQLARIRQVLILDYKGNEAEMARALGLPQTSFNRAINPGSNPVKRETTWHARIEEVFNALYGTQMGRIEQHARADLSLAERLARIEERMGSGSADTSRYGQPGVTGDYVLALLIEDDDGTPLYGYTVKGEVVQLEGGPLRARARRPDSRDATGGRQAA